MFTPNPGFPSGTGGREESMPSLGRQASLGSSLLFPGAQPAGLSPMLAASPGGPMPFSTTMTPGLTQAQRSDAQAATTTTPGNPLTAFKSPSVRFAGNTPAPPKTAPARQMPQSALSAELPPLHSLLDAIGPSSVAPPRAADPCAAPAPATEAASATGAQPVPAAVTASRAEGSAAMGAATAAGATAVGAAAAGAAAAGVAAAGAGAAAASAALEALWALW